VANIPVCGAPPSCPLAFKVTFDRDLLGCVRVVSVGLVTDGSVVGYATTALNVNDLTRVVVRTFGATGAEAERPFHLLLTC
jgi:hypothetical protein